MSQSFRDFTLRLDMRSAAAVKDEAQVDLLGIGDVQLFLKLRNDLYKLAAVLWVLCKQQATVRGLTRDDFDHLCDGQFLEEGRKALESVIVDFQPGPNRKALRDALARLDAVEQQLADQALALLDGPEFDAAVDKSVAEVSASFLKSLSNIGG